MLKKREHSDSALSKSLSEFAHYHLGGLKQFLTVEILVYNLIYNTFHFGAVLTGPHTASKEGVMDTGFAV